jgi:hypothetical protein
VLCIYQESQPISKMISGNSHPRLQVNQYRDAGQAIELTRAFLSKIHTDCELNH